MLFIIHVFYCWQRGAEPLSERSERLTAAGGAGRVIGERKRSSN